VSMGIWDRTRISSGVASIVLMFLEGWVFSVGARFIDKDGILGAFSGDGATKRPVLFHIPRVCSGIGRVGPGVCVDVV